MVLNIFGVNGFGQIDINISEEQIFGEEESQCEYVKNLYSIINQVRYQRQPFCELRILLQGHRESEVLLNSICVLDAQQNCSYRKPYDNFIAELSGAKQMGGQQ